MTKLERMTRKAVAKYVKSLGERVVCVSHVYPRAYVIGRPSHGCMYVATPLCDAAEVVRNSPVKQDGSMAVYCFDGDFRAGDWCSVAYVSTPTTGQMIAVPAVSQPDKGE